ncbi:hypothetical protein [Phenylobacterium montanum]|uniref:Uncharacterized protein n=1 Tax=Phenylobacterium montanum TaxID=2823693 RepID=A0A975IVE7_9CAUL|nr:hypothetical protein [Caulobacter sp. S6]QUD87241.1 hypothetical protein KCG34_19640 [Caulobacter sp. S6]
MALVIADVALGAYFLSGFALLIWSLAIRRKTLNKSALPHPLAFIGPSSWAYAFSGRHRGADDRVLSILVIFWRWAILLLPLGIVAFFRSS